MVYLMSTCGHEVLAAHEGAEGLEKAKAEKPDLILLDIHMPVMDGYEVARRLRADPLSSTIPLVAVTALAVVGDREKMLASGFNVYIGKTIEAQHLPSPANAFLSALAQRAAAASTDPVQKQQSPQKNRPPNQAVALSMDNAQTNIDLVRSIL